MLCFNYSPIFIYFVVFLFIYLFYFCFFIIGPKADPIAFTGLAHRMPKPFSLVRGPPRPARLLHCTARPCPGMQTLLHSPGEPMPPTLAQHKPVACSQRTNRPAALHQPSLGKRPACKQHTQLRLNASNHWSATC